ncbi:alpha/beta hydrolase [Micromonospora sp. WMMD736]|uniref:alpha/beta hydrolase n=1 Tax=Micromonospora sp. WMMD736 TaxID=3404112 RepID=UPI003B92E04A
MAAADGVLPGSGGISLYWRAWLPGGVPRAVVVLAHGGLEHGGRYAHVAARLNEAGLAGYALDFRGHGRSGGRPGQIERMSLLVDDLGRLVRLAGERHAGTPMFLVAHSLGAMVALEYVTSGEHDLAGMVLSGTGIDVSGIPKLQAVLAKSLSALAPNLGLMKVDSGGVSRDPAVVRDYDNDPMVFRGRVPVRTPAELLASSERVTPRLGAIQLPLLVLHGDADVLATPAGARLVYAAAGSDDKTLTIYPGLYHEIFNEPEKNAVLDEVVAWIKART